MKIWVDDRNGRVRKLTPEIYGPIIDEAHKHGMMAVAHVYYLKDAHQLVDAGIDGFMHLVARRGDGRRAHCEDEAAQCVHRCKYRWHASRGPVRKRLRNHSPCWLKRCRRVWSSSIEPATRNRTRRPSPPCARPTDDGKSLARLNAAGITIALGGDTGIPGAWHGWAEQCEWNEWLPAGMTPAQVIVASTSVGAQILKLDDLGAVATGKSADFLVLDANPLENITNTRRISAVYLKGQMLDRSGMHSRWTAGPGSAQRSASAQVPQFTVDPSWPKKFPTVKAADGNLHRWATGGNWRNLHRFTRPYLHAESRLAEQLARQAAYVRGDVERAGAAGRRLRSGRERRRQLGRRRRYSRQTVARR